MTFEKMTLAIVKFNSPDLFFDTKYSTCPERFKVDSITSQGCLVIRVEPILEAVWRFSTCSWFVVRRYNFAVLGCACHSEQNHSTAIHRFTRNLGKLEREGKGVFPQNNILFINSEVEFSRPSGPYQWLLKRLMEQCNVTFWQIAPPPKWVTAFMDDSIQ